VFVLVRAMLMALTVEMSDDLAAHALTIRVGQKPFPVPTPVGRVRVSC